MPLVYVKKSSEDSDVWVACNAFDIAGGLVTFNQAEAGAEDITLAEDDEIRFDSVDVALQFYNWLQTVAEQVI